MIAEEYFINGILVEKPKEVVEGSTHKDIKNDKEDNNENINNTNNAIEIVNFNTESIPKTDNKYIDNVQDTELASNIVPNRQNEQTEQSIENEDYLSNLSSPKQVGAGENKTNPDFNLDDETKTEDAENNFVSETDNIDIINNCKNPERKFNQKRKKTVQPKSKIPFNKDDEQNYYDSIMSSYADDNEFSAVPTIVTKKLTQPIKAIRNEKSKSHTYKSPNNIAFYNNLIKNPKDFKNFSKNNKLVNELFKEENRKKNYTTKRKIIENLFINDSPRSKKDIFEEDNYSKTAESIDKNELELDSIKSNEYINESPKNSNNTINIHDDSSYKDYMSENHFCSDKEDEIKFKLPKSKNKILPTRSKFASSTLVVNIVKEKNKKNINNDENNDSNIRSIERPHVIILNENIEEIHNNESRRSSPKISSINISNISNQPKRISSTESKKSKCNSIYNIKKCVKQDNNESFSNSESKLKLGLTISTSANFNLTEKESEINKVTDREFPIKDYEELTLMERLKYDKRSFATYLKDLLLPDHNVLNIFYLNSLFVPRYNKI